jgi:hypothetical protein
MGNMAFNIDVTVSIYLTYPSCVPLYIQSRGNPTNTVVVAMMQGQH